MPEKPSDVDTALILLEGLEPFANHTLKIIRQARRKIIILSDVLDIAVYHNKGIVTALSEFARSDRNAHVSILVKQTRPLVERNHLILQLARRLPSKVSIRRLLIQPEDDARAYLISDHDTLLYQHQEGEYSGFANYAAKPEAQKIIEEFNYLWQRQSVEDIELRSLTL